MGQLKELPELPEGLSWRRGAKKPVIYAGARPGHQT
jgi:hypothetical protein